MSRSPRSRAKTDRSPFVVGELLPRLPIRNETGYATELLTALEGNPSALLCLPRPGSPASRQIAKKFAELALDIPRLARALLVPAGTPGAEVLSLAESGCKVYAVQQADATIADQDAPACVIADTAGRVLKISSLHAAQIERLGAQIRDASLRDAGKPGAPLARSAPVLMIPDVLSPELCKRLIGYFEQGKTHPSGILDLSGPEPEWRPDPAVKRRQDLRVEDPALTRELEQAVAARVLPEISKCFHYVVTHHEAFKLVRYDEGSGYFRPHRDNESDDTLYRRFAMTLNLNTGAYEGGALAFPEFGPATYRPPLGGAIVFSCSLLHEATDVTRGHRYVALGFFYNPADGLTPEAGRAG